MKSAIRRHHAARIRERLIKLHPWTYRIYGWEKTKTPLVIDKKNLPGACNGARVISSLAHKTTKRRKHAHVEIVRNLFLDEMLFGRRKKKVRSILKKEAERLIMDEMFDL